MRHRRAEHGRADQQDLILTPDNGIAHITQDDFGNTYDRAGGPYCNYKG